MFDTVPRLLAVVYLFSTTTDTICVWKSVLKTWCHSVVISSLLLTFFDQSPTKMLHSFNSTLIFVTFPPFPTIIINFFQPTYFNIFSLMLHVCLPTAAEKLVLKSTLTYFYWRLDSCHVWWVNNIGMITVKILKRFSFSFSLQNKIKEKPQITLLPSCTVIFINKTGVLKWFYIFFYNLQSLQQNVFSTMQT